MSPQMSAGMAVFHSLLLMFAVLALGTTLYLEARTPKNAWKKPPIPQQRRPQGMDHATRQLYMATWQAPASTPTETSEDAA